MPKIFVEPESKDCKICRIHKSKENYHPHPTPRNPNRRRDQCIDCFNILVRERHHKNNTHVKRYAAMAEEQRKEYIKRKSSQNQIRMKTNPNALANKKAYDHSDKGIYARYKGDCKRRGRLERGITMDLTLEQFSVIINKSCNYCGLENCRGVDRIDSSQPYTVENCLPCCARCNAMKSDMTLEQFNSHLDRIIQYRNR